MPRSPHAARSAYPDAFLTPDPLPPSPVPPLLLTTRDISTGAIAPAPAVAVLDFAEVATTLGAMNIGYTEDRPADVPRSWRPTKPISCLSRTL